MGRILLVEDNLEISEICTSMLKSSFRDLDITAVDSGNNAIKLLAKDEHFNLIISDYHMPDGAGHELLSFLININSQMPFVYFTSSLENIDFESYPFSLGVIQKNEWGMLKNVIASSLDLQLDPNL